MTVESIIREIAGVGDNDSNHVAIRIVATRIGVSVTTLYKLVANNNAGAHARRLLDELDAVRTAAGASPTAIEDFRAITGGL